MHEVMRQFRQHGSGLLLGWIGCCLVLSTTGQADELDGRLKVFVLAGQSNMQGHAKVSSFPHLAMDSNTAPLLKDMLGPDGQPRVCDQVWISSLVGPDTSQELFGRLTSGYGARRQLKQNEGKIGPEFTFGITIQKLLQEPVLIIKTAWGGKSLHTDFRPPSAGPFQFSPQHLEQLRRRGVDLEVAKKEKAEAQGRYYRLMVEHVQNTLQRLDRIPDYDRQQGFELAGFVWFQGWNDMVDRNVYPNREQPGGYDAYSRLLAHLIRDVRRDLDAPEMHFVIGVMGVGGPVENYIGDQQRYRDVHDNFRRAMATPLELSEFEGNVSAVFTERYWDAELAAVDDKLNQVNRFARQLRQDNQKEPQPDALSPEELQRKVDAYRAQLLTPRDHEILIGKTNAAYHYLGSAKIMAQIGRAFAQELAPALDAAD